MNQTNRKLGNLASIISAAALGCVGGQNNHKRESGKHAPTTIAERFAAANDYTDHHHAGSVYTGGNIVSETNLAELEAKGFAHFPMPSRRSLGELKNHQGEWTILQKGHVSHGADLAQNVLPYLDGEPSTSKLYQPFALYQGSPEEPKEVVPRIYVGNNNSKYFRGVLDQFAIYHNMEDAVKDVRMIEKVFESRRSVDGSPNITLTPMQITPELLKKYAK